MRFISGGTCGPLKPDVGRRRSVYDMIMQFKAFSKIIAVALLTCVTAGTNSAQTSFGSDTLTLMGGSCEDDEANLDVIRQAALKTLGADQSLLVIARLGSEDHKPRRNQTRLTGVRANFARLQFPPDRLVLAEGEQVKGQGRVEFYIGGRLSYVLLVAPDGFICP